MSDIVQRFEDWWNHDNYGLPLMRVVARRDDYTGARPKAPDDIAGRYTDFDYLAASGRYGIESSVFLADSFPSVSANFGPGSLALYLGAQPVFSPSTVWFEPCIGDPLSYPDIRYDPDNVWWKRHLELIRRLSGTGMRIDIPDIVENIDIYAAMRGPQDTLYDIMDCPERVLELINQIDDTYFIYYDRMRELVRDEDDVVSYTAFAVLGRGRVAKVQCDISAMLSPDQYRTFVLPGLKRQTERLDHSVYHLDGPDAIRHVPAIMELDRLDALQFTCGAGKPDGACPQWYGIYDQVSAAGKSLWIQIYDGGVDDWIRGADSLIERYGKKSLYLIFPGMSLYYADKLMNYACRNWESGN